MIRGFSWSIENVFFVEEIRLVILHTHPQPIPDASNF